MTDRGRERLPREWLPDALAPAHGAGAAEWEDRLQRLMRAAEPALAELERAAGSPAPESRGEEPVGSRRAEAALPWWAVLAGAWRLAIPAAAAAAAALVLALRLVVGSAASQAASPDAFALTAITGGGEAAALWQGAGSEADPVLAQLVVQGGSP